MAGKSFTNFTVPANSLERWVWFLKDQICALIQQFAVISQATATSDIHVESMCMDFDNDQSGNNCIS